MHKIDTPGHSSNTFVAGNPLAQPSPIIPTILGAGWLNTVQGELVYFVETEGLTLDKADNTQVHEAAVKLVERLLHLRYTISATPYAVVSGDGVKALDTFGVAQATAASGAPVELLVAGNVTLPKAAVAMTEGDALYWDNSARNLTTAAVGNFMCCTAKESRVSGDSTVNVRLGILGLQF